MFDLGASELLLIVVVAIVVIGPKDLPVAMRTAGRWIGKIRRVSGHFRAGIDAMVREAELEEMEKKWKEQNAAIMKAHPQPDDAQAPASAHVPASAEAAASRALPDIGPQPGIEQDGGKPAGNTRTAEPQLPLPPP